MMKSHSIIMNQQTVTDKISNLIEIISFKIFLFQIRLSSLDFQLSLTVLFILITVNLTDQLFLILLMFLMIDLLMMVNFLLIIMNSQIIIIRSRIVAMSLKNHIIKSLIHNNLYR